jgi:hypothetical protein
LVEPRNTSASSSPGSSRRSSNPTSTVRSRRDES